MSLSFIHYSQAMIMVVICPMFLILGIGYIPPPAGWIVALIGLISIILGLVRIAQGPEKKE